MLQVSRKRRWICVIVGKVLDMDEKTAIIMTDDFAFLNVVRTSEMAVGKK